MFLGPAFPDPKKAPAFPTLDILSPRKQRMLTPESMEQLTDADLVRAVTSGVDAVRAEAELYRRFAPRIELYGRRHLASSLAAKDLVQEVLLRVIEAVRESRLENPASLASFVLGTCRHVTWDAHRADERRARLARAAAAHRDLAEAPAEPEQNAVLRLMGCVGSLPGREAAVVRMSFWEDRPAEEIGARLGLSAVNVRVIRHRALARLVVCMNPEPLS